MFRSHTGSSPVGSIFFACSFKVCKGCIEVKIFYLYFFDGMGSTISTMYAERTILSNQHKVRWSIGEEPIKASVDTLFFVEEGLTDYPVKLSPVTRLFYCFSELCNKLLSYNGYKSQ